ncbi:hypothetical protein EON76_04480 [bacterium]|nr:MAG: hypothetical protein EON76_04480 [bacterium]
MDEVDMYENSVKYSIATSRQDEFLEMEKLLKMRYDYYRKQQPEFQNELLELLEDEQRHVESEKDFVNSPSVDQSDQLQADKSELNGRLIDILQKAGHQVDASVQMAGLSTSLQKELDWLERMRKQIIERLNVYESGLSEASEYASIGRFSDACSKLRGVIDHHKSSESL